MESPLLLEYLRAGTIAPLKKGDSKEVVEAKLGVPDDWKGRVPGIGWCEPLLTNHHQSWAWHYGSLCIGFPDPSLSGPPGISLNMGIDGPVHFPPPFSALPTALKLRDIVGLLDKHRVPYNDYRGVRGAEFLLISEGDVCVYTRDWSCSPSAQVIYLLPKEFRPDEDEGA